MDCLYIRQEENNELKLSFTKVLINFGWFLANFSICGFNVQRILYIFVINQCNIGNCFKLLKSESAIQNVNPKIFFKFFSK